MELEKLSEEEKRSLADDISRRFDFCEVVVSKNNGIIRSIRGTFEIRFPALREREKQNVGR